MMDARTFQPVVYQTRTLELVRTANGDCPVDSSNNCFAMKTNRTGHFYLLVSLLIIGVAIMILTIITTFVVIYVKHSQKTEPRPITLTASPCDGIQCHFGGECVYDERRHEPFCRCREFCGPQSSSSKSGPICGTDERTYLNECELQVASCKMRTNIYVKHRGTCGKYQEADVERGRKIESNSSECPVQCPLGSICTRRSNVRALQFECVCPEKCDVYEMSDIRKLESIEQFSSSITEAMDTGLDGPLDICGSDGHEYYNLCDLLRTSCRRNDSVRVKYLGKCDPCHGFSCPPQAMCRLDKSRAPSCTCSEQPCYDELFNPEGPDPNLAVCGSDGRSYRSECFLRSQACRSGLYGLRTVSIGHCNEGKHPCSRFECGQNQTCLVDHHGIASCLCPAQCPNVLRTVCGSDGKEYDSECHLQRQACLEQSNVTVAAVGHCPLHESDPCEGRLCPFGGHCVKNPSRTNSSLCECPKCENSPKSRQVCASDRNTYSSECHMQKAACELGRLLNIVHEGRCRVCEDFECTNYARCEVNEFGRAECACPKVCIRIDSPVCGTDGLTYENECELRVRACTLGHHAKVASRGPCDPCQNFECPPLAKCTLDKARTPVCTCSEQRCHEELSNDSSKLGIEGVCGSDGRFYRSECFLNAMSCKTGTSLRIASKDLCSEVHNPCQDFECRRDQKCTVDPNGLPKCSCRSECSELKKKVVCGSNGQTYDSECHLSRHSCLSHENITVASAGPCPPATNNPCHGHECPFGLCVSNPRTKIPTCMCPQCASSNSPVCGSDGKTYENKCTLRKEACERRRTDLSIGYEGPCKE